MQDCYHILQINRFASPKEIKQAYKKLAMQFHPDRNQNNPQAEEKFKTIFEAYRILSDPELKRKHDQHVFLSADKGDGILPGQRYSIKHNVSYDFTALYEAEMAAMRAKKINPNKEWSGSFFFITLGLIVLAIGVLSVLVLAKK